MDKWRVIVQMDILHGAEDPQQEWPQNVPQDFRRDGFVLTADPNAVRSEVEQGPAFQRPRYSTTTERIQGEIVMSGTEVSNFMTFYNDTLSQGAKRFNKAHPITGDTEVMQFDVMQPPRYEPLT